MTFDEFTAWGDGRKSHLFHDLVPDIAAATALSLNPVEKGAT
jgi:hypothetical protein